MQSMPPALLRGEAFHMILQINFNLNVPVAEYQKMADAVAHAFLDVPGLRWKIWLLNPAAQEAVVATKSELSVHKEARSTVIVCV